MAYSLLHAEKVVETLEELEKKDFKKLLKVRRALGRLSANPHHPGLNTQKMISKHGKNGEALWESYVENNTPSAWRIFWHYGPGKETITVFAITPHP